MANSRSKNAKRNIIWAIVNKIITLLMQFLGRTAFIYCLGELYLGLNSLFSSTLNFLSLAELGIGMYKPLADKDTTTICALLNLYRKVYRIIGIIMLVIGFVITFISPIDSIKEYFNKDE